MKLFWIGALIGLFIVAVVSLFGGDNTVHTSDEWNSDCQYGEQYMMPDGTIIKHSECK